MYRLSQLFVTLFAVALSTGLQGQQVTARVAGLESNAKYMSLLEQEQRLHRTEDSVVQVINDTRKLFTAETTDSEKEQLGTKILQLEKELFEIRNQQVWYMHCRGLEHFEELNPESSRSCIV